RVVRPGEATADDRPVEGGDHRGVQEVVGEIGVAVDEPSREDRRLEGGHDGRTEVWGVHEVLDIDMVLRAIPIIPRVGQGGEVIDEGEGDVTVGVGKLTRVGALWGVGVEKWGTFDSLP